MFALWYLISKPRVKASNSAAFNDFGYKKTFSGVGFFLIKDGDAYRMIAKQDFDSTIIDLNNLSDTFQEGKNGCTLENGML